MFAKELEDMSMGKWMYSGKFQKRVFVITRVLVMSADRPERNALTHILGHGGLTTRRWKFTAFINQEKFPSCKLCCNKRLNRYLRKEREHSQSKISTCRWCCDWSFASRSRFVNMDKPEKYPRTQHPTSPNPPMFREVSNINYLIPVEQSFSWLKQGCKFCFHNVYHSYWNLSTSDEYMRCLGLHQSFNRKFVIEKAKELCDGIVSIPGGFMDTETGKTYSGTYNKDATARTFTGTKAPSGASPFTFESLLQNIGK